MVSRLTIPGNRKDYHHHHHHQRGQDRERNDLSIESVHEIEIEIVILCFRML